MIPTIYFINNENMEQISLDETDLQLLDELQNDASLTNQELAQRVNTSACDGSNAFATRD